ncbi:MAG TPA: hypothetical protein VFM41_04910 [Gaiella sp.]|nr:hypothetical protein [Gaiella sp.]
MKRLPLVLSAVALLVALLGSTAVGPAAADLAAKVVPFAKVAGKASFADNAKRLNGRRSSVKAVPNTIPVVGPDGKLPATLGAVGPQGPKGPKGDKGTKGDQGEPGVSGYVHTGVQIPSNPGTDAQYEGAAKCPEGTKLLGGGAYVSPSGYPAALAQSWPRSTSAGDEWYAKGVRYADGGAVRWSIYIHAICGKVAS